MPKRSALLLWTLLGAWLVLHAGGCVARLGRMASRLGSGQPETILESDVAAPPEMESRHASEIDQGSGRLLGGRFTFRGPIQESDAFAEEMVEAFVERGWSLQQRRVGTHEGRLVFDKDTRRVTVDFRSNPINPAMSRATVVVEPVSSGDPAKPGDDPAGGGAA
jgi:hypothetical protein